VDGLERTFATNVFGPLLLTELLLEPLARAEDPRVITAGSTNLKHFFDPRRAIEFDNLRGEHAGTRPYTVYKMYGDSKMGLYLLTRRMAEVYRDRGIKVNCVMIPTVRMERTALRKFRSWFRVVAPLVQYWNPFALSRETMAETYYRLATSDAFREVTGALVDHRLRILPPLPADRRLTPLAVVRELVSTRHAPPYAGDEANVERMWALAREVCGLEEGAARTAGR
jgi:NAD(P)-dependent dehydrogenase (short-subunit alcohol dehydrogenase family)